jgi:hypothetical protein
MPVAREATPSDNEKKGSGLLGRNFDSEPVVVEVYGLVFPGVLIYHVAQLAWEVEVNVLRCVRLCAGRCWEGICVWSRVNIAQED